MAQIIFVLLASPLVVSPLALGAVPLWSRILLEGLSFSTALLCWANAANRQAINGVPGLLPLALLLLFMVLQMLPLPAGLVRTLSPSTWALYQSSIGLVQQPVWESLSVNSLVTFSELLRLGAYFAFYLLTVHLLSDRTRLKRIVWIVLALGVFVALVALAQKQFPNGRIYWLYKVTNGGNFYGPYFNYDHCAAFLAMLAPLGLALYFCYRPRLAQGSSWRQRFARALAHPKMSHHLYLGLAFLILGAAIVVSTSRGGMLSFSLSSLILLVTLHWREKKSIPALVTAAVLILGLVWAVGGVWWGILDQRFGHAFTPSGQLTDGRLEIWRDSLPIMADFPFWGTGWGTFGAMYPFYKSQYSGFGTYQAHSDYIETMVSGGAVSMALLAWFLVAVCRHVAKAVQRRRDPFALHVIWGSLTGCLALLFHSFVDFNFQIPANGLYFFFLLGLAVAAAGTSSQDAVSLAFDGSNKRNGQSLQSLIWCGVAGVFLLAVVIFYTSQYLGERHLASAEALEGSTPSREEQREMLAEYKQARFFAPLNSYIPYREARARAVLGDYEGADHCFRQAIALAPAQSTYLQEYGKFQAGQGKVDLALQLLAAAAARDKFGPETSRDYAKILLASGAREQGLAVLAEVIGMVPKQANGDLQLLVDNGFTVQQIQQGLPRQTDVYLALAAFLEKQGDLVAAEAIYRLALEVLLERGTPALEPFRTVSQFFQRQKRFEEALEVIRQGLKVFPAHIELLERAGTLYQQMNMPDKAAAYYRQVLQMKPGREDVRKRLKAVQ